MKQFDIAIIGAGGAGLSLLYALHGHGVLQFKKVIVFEPEAKVENDRTWCFWSDKKDAAYRMFSDITSHRWSKIRIKEGVVKELTPYQYYQIRSSDFYAMVKSRLQDYPNISWVSEQIASVEQVGEKVVLKSANETFEAQLTFDSRPPRDIPSSEVLWQSFVGWRIRTKEGSFDPSVCTFMDFEVPQEVGLQFMYWLPTSENEGLLEYTRFGADVLSEEESRTELEAYLKKLGVSDYEILEKEINKIPMSLALNQKQRKFSKDQRIIPIGARGGAIKASTGFAFKRMCDHAWALADALKTKQALPSAGNHPRFALYDELLMRIMAQKGHLSKKLFVRLFDRHPIQRIFRFLDEVSSFSEDLKIMYQMPWWPFFWSIGFILKGDRSIGAQANKKPSK